MHAPAPGWPTQVSIGWLCSTSSGMSGLNRTEQLPGHEPPTCPILFSPDISDEAEHNQPMETWVGHPCGGAYIHNGAIMSTWNIPADYGHRPLSTSEPPEQQSPLLTCEDCEHEGIRLSDHEHAMPIQQHAASPLGHDAVPSSPR